MESFEDSNLRDDVKAIIKEKFGFEKPTLIQALTIPAVLEDKDIIGQSATGSGKTLAFGIGVIEHVIPKDGLQALIITPTRELTEQVHQYITKLVDNFSMFQCFYLWIYRNTTIYRNNMQSFVN
jgi:superfamily II DNA/RNA helicase